MSFVIVLAACGVPEASPSPSPRAPAPVPAPAPAPVPAPAPAPAPVPAPAPESPPVPEEDLPRLAACVAPPGGFDPAEIFDEGTTTAERVLVGEVVEVGAGAPPDDCFLRAVVGHPGFSDTWNAHGSWLVLDTDDGPWVVGVVAEGRPADVAVGDRVGVRMFDARHGFEGADYGWFQLWRDDELLFELVEDESPYGEAAADPRLEWSYTFGAPAGTTHDGCGRIRYRGLHAAHGADRGDIPYGATGRIGDYTVVNSGAIEQRTFRTVCADWWPGRILAAAWPG